MAEMTPYFGSLKHFIGFCLNAGNIPPRHPDIPTAPAPNLHHEFGRACCRLCLAATATQVCRRSPAPECEAAPPSPDYLGSGWDQDVASRESIPTGRPAARVVLAPA